ncbi:hypothetical protein CKA81_10035 [Pollutimonas thiosulfatoxidans]|uniref:DUF4142 domain-containing protein n=2 Tax=Pollutimonas thiosulfatoxidans TaxID=2028345 RepID=A0A410GCY4_9BURK|nr:hypothetical protein CKA81_10035 [Pollutimonas thiosulfatoxidans]
MMSGNSTERLANSGRRLKAISIRLSPSRIMAARLGLGGVDESGCARSSGAFMARRSEARSRVLTIQNHTAGMTHASYGADHYPRHPGRPSMNRYRSTLLISLAASMITLAGCSTPQANSPLSAADQTFLENAAQGNYAEIEGSRMAQEKATSQDVLDFAANMIREHTRASEKLSALAKRKSYVPPMEPSIVQRTELKSLSLLSGNAFNKMYVDRIGVAAHTATIQQFETAAANAQDPDVRDFAQDMLPSLRHHLEMAQALNQKQKAE